MPRCAVKPVPESTGRIDRSGNRRLTRASSAVAEALTAGPPPQRRDVIASEMSESAWKSVMAAGIAIDDLQSSRDDLLRIYRAQMAIDPATAEVVKAADALGLDFALDHSCADPR
jgi:hypothetical protein